MNDVVYVLLITLYLKDNIFFFLHIISGRFLVFFQTRFIGKTNILQNKYIKTHEFPKRSRNVWGMI